jgi:mono/diheme cytochrome c family protein
MKRWARRGLIGTGVVTALAGVAVGGVYGASAAKLSRTMPAVHRLDFAAPSGAEAVAKGKHLYESLTGCIDCHGPDGAGVVVVPGGPMGTIVGANVTPGGRVQSYSDSDLERIIRHGVRPDDTTVKFMPVFDYINLSDEEIGQVIAYLRSLAPQQVVQPAPSLGPLARVLLLADAAPVLVPALGLNHDAPHRAQGPEPGPTVDYGAYRANGCIGCHGENLSGGPIPGGPPDWPPARNLTLHESGLAGWTREDFVHAMREGERPDGTPIRMPMPIAATRLMTDVELDALWAYIQSLTPTPYASGRE